MTLFPAQIKRDPDYQRPLEEKECNIRSCNGLEFHVPYQNETIIFGQCPDTDHRELDFCFVEKDSVCSDTIESTNFTGMYISKEACRLKSRFIGALFNFLSEAWKQVANAFAGLVDYNEYPYPDARSIR